MCRSKPSWPISSILVQQLYFCSSFVPWPIRETAEIHASHDAKRDEASDFNGEAFYGMHVNTLAYPGSFPQTQYVDAGFHTGVDEARKATIPVWIVSPLHKGERAPSSSLRSLYVRVARVFKRIIYVLSRIATVFSGEAWRETNRWRWPLFMVGYPFADAYHAGVVFGGGPNLCGSPAPRMTARKRELEPCPSTRARTRFLADPLSLN